MNETLLSICIPTYNRCEVLDKVLANIFNDKDYNAALIEVIVSDNCSTDNTAQIVSKYPLVKYYRNLNNIKDVNFSVCLDYATGKYLRLVNDTVIFKPGALKFMLDKISENINGEKNIFFYKNTFLHENCEVRINSKASFLEEVSFYLTWIANFGVWREDFIKIQNKNRYAELQFGQVDWSLRIVENNKDTIVYFDDFFEVITPKNKGGYHIFNTFINKYLLIIKNENFSIYQYEVEKYRLLRYFIYSWYLTLFITNKESFSFDTKGTYKIILKKYWYHIYIYPLYIRTLMRNLK
nr:glycosyltransferase family 2 protein [uncultured Pedobacter sp.]